MLLQVLDCTTVCTRLPHTPAPGPPLPPAGTDKVLAGLLTAEQAASSRGDALALSATAALLGSAVQSATEAADNAGLTASLIVEGLGLSEQEFFFEDYKKCLLGVRVLRPCLSSVRACVCSSRPTTHRAADLQRQCAPRSPVTSSARTHARTAAHTHALPR